MTSPSRTPLARHNYKARKATERARSEFNLHMEALPEQFRASVPYNRGGATWKFVSVEGVSILRSNWRVWISRGWVYQVEGETWAKVHRCDRLNWEEGAE